MASRYRSFTRPAASLLRSTVNKSAAFKSKPSPSLFPASPSPSSTFSRLLPQLGALQSLLPLHSAVSSARLTSCLGVNPSGSRSLSQGTLCGANPGV